MLKYLMVGVVVVVLGLGGFLFVNRQTVKGVLPAIRPAIMGRPQVNVDIKDLKLEEYVANLGNPRDMEFDAQGRLLVAITGKGQVVGIVNNEATPILEGLNQPHGLAFLGGKLYVAETDSVKAYEYDTATGKASGGREVTDLPSGKGHFTRSLLAYQNKLLISVGSSCNVCNEGDKRRAAVLIYDPQTNTTREFARGLRNSVFMALHPKTGEVWATDMGRDWLGDNLPPDEINIVKDGGDYGWPNCFGKNVHDDDFDAKKTVNCEDGKHIATVVDLPAHSAPLGLTFIPDSWGSLAGNLLVSYHGSWNRTEPTGYKVVMVKLDKQGNSQGIEDVFSFRNESGVVGRPADVIFDGEGNLYISDDKAGKIFIVRKG